MGSQAAEVLQSAVASASGASSGIFDKGKNRVLEKLPNFRKHSHVSGLLKRSMRFAELHDDRVLGGILTEGESRNGNYD
jgi:hypothetical protein